jgi:2-dehydropantoate 2-reductase
MRYLIAGTGALGSVFGGLLQLTGQSVDFLGRGKHFDQARTQGLTIDGIWGEFRVGPIKALLPEPQSGKHYDVILLCVNSFATRDTCRQLQGRLAPGGLIVSVQNGLGNLEIIAQDFGETHTVGARVIFGARITRPGLATVTVYAAPVLLGALNPQLPGDKLTRVATDLNRAGIPTEVVAEIIPHLWDKVLYNCALNPLGAILGAPYGALGDDPETRELMRLIIEEIYAVAGAKGIKLHHPDAAGYFRHFLENLVPPTAAHWPSMWQDLQAGRRTEIEALNGAICRYGRELGLATPHNETLSRLIRFMENRLTRPKAPIKMAYKAN